MKIAVGSDHAAFEHKQYVVRELREAGHEVSELGATSTEPYDYPDAAAAVARAVSGGKVARGVLLCGTGLGMCMTANKVHGIRAAACHDEYTTIMSRSHNDANVLCLGGRVLTPDKAMQLVHLWLKTPFEGGRHTPRLKKITDLEQEECRGK
ncbi:MAG TPA: ribose 5-phosphate isomerase B [Planctomycetota bacterium]|nr:ribose 5-phosphate isomerase B [Planctomycetota bacterium]